MTLYDTLKPGLDKLNLSPEATAFFWKAVNDAYAKGYETARTDMSLTELHDLMSRILN